MQKEPGLLGPRGPRGWKDGGKKWSTYLDAGGTLR